MNVRLGTYAACLGAAAACAALLGCDDGTSTGGVGGALGDSGGTSATGGSGGMATGGNGTGGTTTGGTTTGGTTGSGGQGGSGGGSTTIPAGTFLMDDDGYVRFVGRSDDVIISAGYRIGPGEIEDCLLGHPAVKMAAVIGVPDETRNEVVKAYIVPDEQATPGQELVQEIQQYVKVRLAAHEYPRQITFVDTLPLTTTGKVMRRKLREWHSQEKT